MKLLELFAGSRSFCKVAEEHGWETFSSDIEPFEKIDYVTSILEFDVSKVPFVPDVIHASPPCTGFSVAAISHNWAGGKGAYIPKSDTAKLGIKLAKKAIEIIEHFKRLNPNLIWYMENPRGVMRKMPFMEALPIRHTTTYCSYQDKRMKPTDWWSNNPMWSPRKKCKNGGYGSVVIDGKTWALNENGGPCHEAAPRGAKTGTQGLKGDYDRSKIPQDLCEELVKAAELKMAFDKTIPTPDIRAAAAALGDRLKHHAWFYSAGAGENCLILFLNREMSDIQRTMLPEFCEGFAIEARVMGKVVPATADETNEGESA